MISPVFVEQAVSEEVYFSVLWISYGVVALTVIGSIFVIAPYGKFGGSQTLGVELPSKVGWWLMEIMASVCFAFFYPLGKNSTKPVPIIFAFLYAIHYANRGWYFPWAMRVAPNSKTNFSFTVSASGILVTALHGYLNALWYSQHCSYLDWNWLFSPLCVFGLLLYQTSFWSTIYLEAIMRNLRDPNPRPGDARYKIPRGYLFEYVSSPQYLTELLGFLGWAIMTWSPAGLFIFSISCANLIPRAIETHKWYRGKFEDYPAERKILIPFVW